MTRLPQSPVAKYALLRIQFALEPISLAVDLVTENLRYTIPVRLVVDIHCAVQQSFSHLCSGQAPHGEEAGTRSACEVIYSLVCLEYQEC